MYCLEKAKDCLCQCWQFPAIIVRSDRSVIWLSRDHKPSKLREVEQIKKLSGHVIHKNRWRVEGQLAVSRAIGDAALKPYITSEPDTVKHIIGKSFAYSPSKMNNDNFLHF